MNKGPNIVANRWHEVASSLEKTGFFQEDQLNLEDVLRILPDLVRRYTAVLGYVAEGELTPNWFGNISETKGRPVRHSDSRARSGGDQEQGEYPGAPDSGSRRGRLDRD